MSLDKKLKDQFGREILPKSEVLVYCHHYGSLKRGVIRKINDRNIIIDMWKRGNGKSIYQGERWFSIYSIDKYMIVLDEQVTQTKHA